jgi:hypothetical protein
LINKRKTVKISRPFGRRLSKRREKKSLWRQAQEGSFGGIILRRLNKISPTFDSRKKVEMFKFGSSLKSLQMNF